MDKTVNGQTFAQASRGITDRAQLGALAQSYQAPQTPPTPPGSTVTASSTQNAPTGTTAPSSTITAGAYKPVTAGQAPTYGTSGQSVMDLQKSLNDAHKNDPNYTPLVVDGKYGPLTQAATNYKPGTAPLTDQQKLDKAYADMESHYADVSKNIDDIRNGVIPLSSGEQAQITALQNQFRGLIDEQKLQNKGASGLANIRGYQSGAAEYDPTFQTKTIGAIVTAGLNKVADLNMKMAGEVAKLTQSFKDDKIKDIKDAWDMYHTFEKERADHIQKTIDDAYTKMKDQRDYNLQAAKFQLDRQKTMQDIEKGKIEISKLKGENVDPSQFAYGSSNYLKAVMAQSVKNGTSKLTEGERTKLAKSFSAIDQLQNVNALMKQVKTGPFSGRFQKFITTLGGAPDSYALQAALNGLVPGIARGTFGEVGVLTDNDIKIYSKTIPNINATADQNKLVQAVLLKTIQSGIKNQIEIAAGSGINVSDLVNKYDAVSKNILNIENDIGVTKQRVVELVQQNPDLQPVVEGIIGEGGNYGDVLLTLGAY